MTSDFWKQFHDDPHNSHHKRSYAWCDYCRQDEWKMGNMDFAKGWKDAKEQMEMFVEGGV